MNFLTSTNCICGRCRSRDLHHVLIQVPMRASKDSLRGFFGLCRLSQGETFTLASGLGYAFMLATLLVISCICMPLVSRFSYIIKVCKFHGFVTIYRGSAL